MSTETYMALCGVGADRLGLVAEITDYVTERGCNVEDSRMAVLGAEFGVLLLVSGAAEQVSAVERDLGSLAGKTGLQLVARKTKSPEEHRAQAGVPYVVAAQALDHEGIVRAVARALHGAGVNIVSLTTTAYEAPVTGSQLFRMEARVDVPPGVSGARVRKALDAVAEAENLDLELRPA